MQRKLTSGDYVGFPAITAQVRAIFEKNVRFKFQRTNPSDSLKTCEILKTTFGL